MWTRSELKKKAKAALGRNYWRIVLASIILSLFGGGLGVGYTYNHAYSDDDIKDVQDRYREEGTLIFDDEYDEYESWQSEMGIDDELTGAALIMMMVTFLIVFLVVFIVVFAVSYLFQAFLLNPLTVGIRRFMAKSIANESENAEIAELAFGFDHSYQNIVKTMFHMDLSVFLWSLLFVLPGIYKKYQYRMVPYILTEYPDMPYQEALNLSKMMMDGEKWNAFVLDLSFFPWMLLTIITCGMVGIFYVEGYYQLTCGALYLALRQKGRQEYA